MSQIAETRGTRHLMGKYLASADIAVKPFTLRHEKTYVGQRDAQTIKFLERSLTGIALINPALQQAASQLPGIAEGQLVTAKPLLDTYMQVASAPKSEQTSQQLAELTATILTDTTVQGDLQSYMRFVKASGVIEDISDMTKIMRKFYVANALLNDKNTTSKRREQIATIKRQYRKLPEISEVDAEEIVLPSNRTTQRDILGRVGHDIGHTFTPLQGNLDILKLKMRKQEDKLKPEDYLSFYITTMKVYEKARGVDEYLQRIPFLLRNEIHVENLTIPIVREIFNTHYLQTLIDQGVSVETGDKLTPEQFPSIKWEKTAAAQVATNLASNVLEIFNAKHTSSLQERNEPDERAPEAMPQSLPHHVTVSERILQGRQLYEMFRVSSEMNEQGNESLFPPQFANRSFYVLEFVDNGRELNDYIANNGFQVGFSTNEATETKRRGDGISRQAEFSKNNFGIFILPRKRVDGVGTSISVIIPV